MQELICTRLLECMTLRRYEGFCAEVAVSIMQAWMTTHEAATPPTQSDMWTCSAGWRLHPGRLPQLLPA